MGDSLATDQKDWMKTTLGLDVDSYGSQASTDGATGGAGETASDPPNLQISASSNGDGSFVITGTGFTATETAHIRCVDDKFYEVWGTAPAQAGKFTFTTGNVCMNPGGNRYFQANDGSFDPNETDITKTHWSNVVTITCDPKWATPPDKGDDPDPPDAPDPPAAPDTPDDGSQSGTQ